ncbi:uncharacterized protein LOC129582319 [Paramacrobiotus metropolitanus]|uniref:uncharacterized protein LOC129582319 n=1 Tax=Paramacrobiotus metropolitanus TaxID=2943436 RepID=UPI002445B0EA|nr:uncharacterized protein LOC129582319 [Paramacrobiotus metropolitanus]
MAALVLMAGLLVGMIGGMTAQKPVMISGLACNCTCAIPPTEQQEILPVFQREGPFFLATFNCNAGQHLGFIRASIATGEPLRYTLLGTPYLRIDPDTGDLYIQGRVPATGYYNATVAAQTDSGKVSTRAGKVQLLCGPDW